MKKVLLVLLVLILGFCGFVATRPSTFHIERSTSIAAPAEIVYAKISDFHQWGAWSPWEKLDPEMKRTFEGADAGMGAGYAWVGNKDVGEGRMTITEAVPPSKVVIRLEFLKPWQATNTATFTLSPSGTGTDVNWAMDGTNNFMSKAMGVFMNMDKLIGADFEKGLAALKTVSEAEAQALSSAADSTQAAPVTAP